WPAELKCRSRMHYYLADRLAAQAEPGSRALLLDEDGFVCETSTTNVAAFFHDTGVVSPRPEKVLPGISLQVAEELASDFGIGWSHRDFRPDELTRADEVFVTSTPNCILPVTRLNGRPIGAGRPGPVFTRFLAAWNKLVGVDVAAQASRFAKRPAKTRLSAFELGETSDDALSDPLTGLPNRRLFQRRLEQAIYRAGGSAKYFAVLFIDLDRFKEVNDRNGHLRGDKLLVAAARRLAESIRPLAIVARRDGDEFTVLLDDLHRPEDAVGVAQRIVDHFRAPLAIQTDAADTPTQRLEFAASISIGIAVGSGADAPLTVDQMISRADTAMYQ